MKKSLLVTFFLLFSLIQVNSFAADSIVAHKAEQSLLLDVQQLASGKLFAVGERGHVLVSEDQAGSWQQVITPTQSTLTAVDFLNDNVGLAVGFEQTIVRTEDGGLSWTLAHFEEDAFEQPALFDVKFINENLAIAIGAYGLMLQSDDGGKSWENREVLSLADIYEGFSHFYGLEQLSDSHLILVGEKYVSEENDEGEEINTALLAESLDSGKSWNKIQAPYDGSFFGVTYDGNNKIYAYGLRGNAYVSKDMGKTWKGIFLSTAAGLHDMAILPNGKWIMVGTGGLLVSKSNTGTQVQKRIDLKGRAAILALNEQELVIVGEGGVEKITLNQK